MNSKHSLKDQWLAGAAAYWPRTARLQTIETEGRTGRPVPLPAFEENTFYLLNGDALLALTHALGDLALEAATGEFTAAIQRFDQFEPLREVCEQLAFTIDRVQVIGAGRAPAPLHRVAFTPDKRGACRRHWMTAYHGPAGAALLLASQRTDAGQFEDRGFTAMLTTHPKLALRLRDEQLHLLAGKVSSPREFVRLMGIDQAGKAINGEFLKQRQAVEAAMRQCLVEGGPARAGRLASELERSVSRLHAWKARLPALLNRPQGR